MTTATSLSAVCVFAAFCLLLGSSKALTGEVTITSTGEARSSAGGTTSIGGSGRGEVSTSTSPTIQGSLSAESSPGSSSSAESRATIRTDTGSTSISISTSSDDDGETIVSDSSQGQTSIQISTSSSGDEPEPEVEPEVESETTEMNTPAPEMTPSPSTDLAPPVPMVAPQVLPSPTETPPSPFSIESSFPPPAPISKDAAAEIQEKYGIDIFDMRECRGAADWKCCDVQDFIEKDSSTFCGCATSFRIGGLDPDFCRWERIHNDPSIWMETRDGVPDAFKFCRCSNSGYKPCDGLTKRECCDSYMGLDTCQCNGTLCNYKKVQENPLVWEDQFIAEGRRCKCDF